MPQKPEVSDLLEAVVTGNYEVPGLSAGTPIPHKSRALS